MKNIVLLTCLCLSGWQCSHYYYVPGLPHTPTPLESGQTTLNIAAAAQNESYGFEAQGSTATSDNLLFTGEVAYFNSGKTKTADYFERNIRGYNLSGGGGIYSFRGAYNAERGWHLSALGNVGFGSVTNEYFRFDHQIGHQVSAGTSTVNNLRLSIQPAAGWTSPWFDAVLSARLSGVYHARIDFNTTGSVTADDDKADLQANPFEALLEPGLTLRTGFRKAKLQLQITGPLGAQTPASVNIGLGVFVALRR